MLCCCWILLASLLSFCQVVSGSGANTEDFFATMMVRNLVGPTATTQLRRLLRGNTAFVHMQRSSSISGVESRGKSRRNISSLRLSSSSQISDNDSLRPIKNVAIVGGGLAGMSVAYHLLDIAGSSSSSSGMQISIYDKANVGEGGASSVAGGLLHPFSPRGKLIHMGLAALHQSNHLLQMASKHQPQCVVRPHLYRIAMTDKNVIQLEHTAEHYPNLATWMSKEEIQSKFGVTDSLGGLELGNGCKVINVPLYLKGLYEECQRKAKEMNGTIKWELMDTDDDDDDTNQKNVESSWKDIDSFHQHLAQYDAVILSAGAGLLHDQLITEEDELPVNLVRGQSIEMTLSESDDDSNNDNLAITANEGLMSGKYVLPILANTMDAPGNQTKSPQRFVIGATHEFKEDALTPNEVMEELKSRSYPLAQHLWDHGTVDRLTSGVRLQSNRGKFGRMPIIGRHNSAGSETNQNSWLFTGLSSRGLIHHGLFGRWLANAVINDNEEMLRDDFAEFDWWRRKKEKAEALAKKASSSLM